MSSGGGGGGGNLFVARWITSSTISFLCISFLCNCSSTIAKKRNVTKKKTDVVHEINCQNCDQSYIGKTKKMLQDRVTEHEINIRTKYQNSLIY